jgi:MoxR-like ATPase
MMTHNVYKVIGEVRSSRKNSIQILSVPEDAQKFFKVGEWLWSRDFANCEPGKYEVTYRISNSYTSSDRRYVLRVQKYLSSEPVNISDFLEHDGSETPAILVQSSKSKIFHVEPEHYEIYNLATSMLLARPEKPVRILMVGKSGYGKTSLPAHYAKVKNMDYFRMNCASVRDPEEWFGTRQAHEGSTSFEPSEFIKRVTKGDCVVVLDEFNRVEPWLANTLFPLLDDDASTVINNQEFKVGQNVLFVMTINIGHRFSGTFNLDAALANRVDMFCEVGPLPADKEIQMLMNNTGISNQSATQIVGIAKTIRDMDTVECSTRSTIRIAELVAAGATIRSALQHAVISRCLSDMSLLDCVKDVIDVINVQLGPYKPNFAQNHKFN